MKRALTMVALLAAVTLAGCSDKPGEAAADCDVPEGRSCVALHTELGTIVLELFNDKVPVTAGNFVALARDGSYDGSPFHRVISGFMMQGGDYTLGNGGGGAAHADYDPDGDGNIVDEFDPELRHDKAGTLSMANTGAPDSGGSQFFITFGPTPHLDAYSASGQRKQCGAPRVSCHAVFGRVIEGMDVVEQVDSEVSSQTGKPRQPLTLQRAEVLVDAAGTPPEQTATTTTQSTGPAVATGDPNVTLGLITPQSWHVNGKPDHMMFWAHNTGGDAEAADWSVTQADGSPLPAGWDVTFQPAQSDLGAGNARVGKGSGVDYADWRHTTATLSVPDDAAGTLEAMVHLGAWSTPFTFTLSPRVPVAQPGTEVNVATVGTLQRNGEEFWSGDFPTQAGTGGAVTGYRLGLLGLADGETASLVVPPPFAYGYTGYSAHELADETLVFTVTPHFV